MAKRNFRLYVGYYEVLITTKEIDAPYTLVSKHTTAENAEKRAEKWYPSATILFDEDAVENAEYNWIITDYEPIVDENGLKWWTMG